MSITLDRPAAGNVTDAFGPRPAPTRTSPAIHYGIDYGWGNGKDVWAAASGTVVDTSFSGSYGNRIRIQHAPGVETWYCHLEAGSVLVRPGDHVMAGLHIATMGDTGNVTAVHLHFELRINGTAVDPAPYMIAAAAVASRPIEKPAPREDTELRILRIVMEGGLNGTLWAIGPDLMSNLRDQETADHDAAIWNPGGKVIDVTDAEFDHQREINGIPENLELDLLVGHSWSQSTDLMTELRKRPTEQGGEDADAIADKVFARFLKLANAAATPAG